MVRLLAEQKYIKVIREIDSLTQIDTEQERIMYLYEDRVVTKYREFPIEDIMDLSHRLIGKKGGLLYLHTSKGVFSYIVKSSPDEFMQTCKKLKGMV